MRTLLLCVVASAGIAQVPGTPDIAEEAALRLFERRVQEYAALHRSLEGPLPPLTSTRETFRNFVSRQLLASAIRRARPDARQGDIFSPDVALAFRGIVARSWKGRDVESMLSELNEEHAAEHDLRVQVNEPLPASATHEVPASLLYALPPLPEDVEYRIVNHDLVLWDIHANLVVDVLPFAFRPLETTMLR